MLRNYFCNNFEFVAKKTDEICAHCVCVLAVLIKRTDPFYDFAVEDKWRTVKEAMRTMSIRFSNPHLSTHELTTL